MILKLGRNTSYKAIPKLSMSGYLEAELHFLHCYQSTPWALSRRWGRAEKRARSVPSVESRRAGASPLPLPPPPRVRRAAARLPAALRPARHRPPAARRRRYCPRSSPPSSRSGGTRDRGREVRPAGPAPPPGAVPRSGKCPRGSGAARPGQSLPTPR